MSDDMSDRDMMLRVLAQAIVDSGTQFIAIDDIQPYVVCLHCGARADASMLGPECARPDLVHSPDCANMLAVRTLAVLAALDAKGAPKPTIHHHLFSLGFSVTTPHKAEDVTAQELLDALHNRFLDLDNSDTDEIVEACGPPDDTEEIAE